MTSLPAARNSIMTFRQFSALPLLVLAIACGGAGGDAPGGNTSGSSNAAGANGTTVGAAGAANNTAGSDPGASGAAGNSTSGTAGNSTSGAGGGGNNGTGFSCPASPGTAPSGTALTATRITAADPGPTDYDWFLYEGPVWHQGALYLSRLGSPSKRNVFKLEGGVFSAVEQIPNSNGLATDGTNIFAASYNPAGVVKFDAAFSPSNVVTEYMSKSFQGVNDLALHSNGSIFFTDPHFQKQDNPSSNITDKSRVYQFKDGNLTVIEEGMQSPNGVSISNDGSTLYVASGDNGGSGAITSPGNVVKYPIAADGTVGAGTLFATVGGVLDGMTIDCLGNVYVVQHSDAKVQVYSPTGENIATISRDGTGSLTNVAFGGAEGKTLYITGEKALWSIELDVVGQPY